MVKIGLHKDVKVSLLVLWTISVLFTVCIGLIVKFIPIEHLGKWIPACSAKLNGGSCIFCGSTRSLYYLANLDFKAAFELNPFAFFVMFGSLVNLFIFLWFIINRYVKFS